MRLRLWLFALFAFFAMPTWAPRLEAQTILDSRSNLCKVAVSGLYGTSETTITLVATDPNLSKLPSLPFAALWWDAYHYPDPSDDAKAEFVTVTAKPTGNTITVTRAQQGTLATTKNNTGGQYKIARVWSKKDIDDTENRFWQLSVSVKDYGAVGDGVTDDAPEIQDAVDAVSPSGGVVLLPQGVYFIGSTVTLKDRVILQGVGPAASILYSTANTTLMKIGTGTASCTYAGIRDLKIKGNNTGASQIGLLLNGTSTSFYVMNFAASNVVIEQCGGTFLKTAYSWVCGFYGCKVGTGPSSGKLLAVESTCNLLAFRDCSFVYSTYAGYVMTVDGTGHTLDNCQVQDNEPTTGGIINLGTASNPAENCRVIHCWFEANKGGDTILVAGNSNTTTEISNCIFTQAATGTSTYVIDLTAGKNHRIKGNTFRNNAGTAYINLGASQSYAFISGNRVLDGTSTRIANPSNGSPVLLFAFDDAGYQYPQFRQQLQMMEASMRIERTGQDGAVFIYSVGDANARLTWDTYGEISWGPGNAAADTGILRDSSSYLRMAYGDSFGSNIFEVNTALTAAPGSPRTGMFVRADRATWDPLSKGSGGSYFVWYNGSAWVALDSQ